MKIITVTKDNLGTYMIRDTSKQRGDRKWTRDPGNAAASAVLYLSTTDAPAAIVGCSEVIALIPGDARAKK